MAVLNPFDSLMFALGSAKHDFTTLDMRFVLTNTAPNAGWDVYADVTGELATGGGYTSGGVSSTLLSYTQSGSSALIKIADPPSWTASGGGFGPARYVVARNADAPSQELIGWIDNGSSFSRTAGQQFSIDIEETDGLILTLRLAP